MRKISLGAVSLPGMWQTNFSLSFLLLSFLLFNAGLGLKTKELASLRTRPHLLVTGFLANSLIPILLVLALRGLLAQWHSNEELQNLLVGLALIIAMPIAGSSANWAQNANGNLGLSLGLVLCSTILSPFTTPLVLRCFGNITQGDYSEDLHEMATQGTDAFLCLTVVVPSLLGMLAHYLLGEERTTALKSQMKLANFIVLLLLNYSNACVSLPQVFAHPDWDLLVLIIAITISLCASAFFAGWLLAKAFKTDKADQAALMFSLGMNNNGTGLVLAASALADHSAVLLPMIFYTLVQQTIAAIVDWRFFRNED